jgi:4-amino-4-deoxy-L-arabinose transferase-like glycosyltransferase
LAELQTRPPIERAALAAVLVVAAGLRLWDLEANGFGNEYYAAGVRSMLQGGWLFLYNAFDPAGFVSLDKPPLAFWFQTVTASLLGFSGWTIHLPQALAGTASVAILHSLVRRPFGTAAGLIAAILLALSPVAVAVDRSNNTDSWLVLLLLLAAAAALRGRGLALVAAMALLGLAFNVKMLAALVCGPALVGAWLMAAPFNWLRHLRWLFAGGATLVVVGLSWTLVFDLTPRDIRPYAGSSTGNSMFELVVMHNGLDRFVLPSRTPTPALASRLELYDTVPAGPLRLTTPMLAAQFAWWLPIAIVALFFVRRPHHRPSLMLWGLWALGYGVVYSAAGGIFHIYYLATLAPPLAALAGIGFNQLWRRGSTMLSMGVGATALWQVWLVFGTLGWLTAWMAAPIAAFLAALAARLRDKRPPAVLGSVALFVLPAAWALSPIFSPGNLILPSASLPRWLGQDDSRGIVLSRSFRQLSDDPKLHEFLLAERGKARFLVATPNALLAAPIILGTGQPAMAVGGFSGRDPILDTDAFARLVARGEVRFVLLGDAARDGAFAKWVRENGKRVDERLWRSLPTEPRRSITLYDLASR